LLTLDDPLGSRITPVRVIAVNSGDGELGLLYRFFAEWEMWTAEVLESHVSYAEAYSHARRKRTR
jgi:hypothetical protein